MHPFPFSEPVERAEFHDIHAEKASFQRTWQSVHSQRSRNETPRAQHHHLHEEGTDVHDVYYPLSLVSSYRLKVNELPNTVYELMSVWSDLKHMRTREYVGEPLVDAEDQTTKGAVTPVKKQERSSRVPDSGRSTRAPSVDVSPRSPKSPKSPALLPLESNRFCRTIDRVTASVNSAIASRGGHLLSALSVTSFQSCAYLASVCACREGL